MSKTLKTAALVVGAVALVATGIGAAAGAGLLGAAAAGATGTVLGISTATIGAIGTFASLAAAALSVAASLTAKKPSVEGNPTNFTTNPQSGLPYAMGRCRMSGLRIYADTNTRPGWTKFNDLLWFGVLLSAGGAIDSIEQFTADNEVVTFDSGGNAIGKYHDYQGQKIHLGGTQASAIALSLMSGTAPGWDSSNRLSGMTHAMWCLRYEKDGELYGAGVPEPAWIGKWVKTYDPRKDSTYPGGSGSHRALNESTYEWSDNPGLHALTWALGRWQNGKRTCGIGAPVAMIRVADFVECANVCDANDWRVGGVEWTTDSKWDIFKRILQAGGAVPTQTGAMIGCLVSTPRTAIATIESRHLLDNLSIAATKSRRDRFNSVIPRYVNEENEWSVIPGSQISVPAYVTADGGQRTKEIDYSLVPVFSGETATQPGQLAAYDIVNSREAGPITFTTGPEWMGLKTGDVIYLNVPEEGLINQPVLITRRAPDPSTGKVSFAAETETYSKHAFALGQSTIPPAPFALSAPDLKPVAPVETNWNVAGTTSGEGFPALLVTGESELPSADAIVIDYKKSADTAWTSSATLAPNGEVSHVIAPLASETAYDVRIGYKVGELLGNFTIFANVVTGLGKITVIENSMGGTVFDLEAVMADINFQADTILEQVLRGDTFQALLAARTLIDGVGVNSVITSFQDQQATANESFANKFDLIGAEIDGGAGFILNTSGVYVTPTESLATRLDTVSASLGANTGSIEELRDVVIDPSGATVRSVLRLNADGHVTGMIQTNDGTEGSVVFLVDRFAIVDPGGGSPFSPFQYADGVIKMGAVEVDTLKVGTGGTNAPPVFAEATTPIAGDGTWKEVLAAPVEMKSAGAIQVISSFGQSFPSGDKTWNSRIEIGSVLSSPRGGEKTADSVSLMGVRQAVPAGTYVVRLMWNGQSGCSITARNMSISRTYGE